jgi:chromosome partitioning protein
MSLVIAVVNQKGGVGKTTTCLSLGASLNELGKRVLLVDLDPQVNLSVCAGVRDSEEDFGFADFLDDALQKNSEISAAIHPVSLHRGLDLIPGDPTLVLVENRARGLEGYEYALSKAMRIFETRYDYILIDCSPSLGPLTLMALTAAHHALVPLQADYLAAWGVMQLAATIEAVHQRTNPHLEYSLLCVMYDRRNNISRQMLERLRESFSDHLWDVVIGLDTRLREAVAVGEPITRYAPKSRAAQQYRELARAFLRHFEGSMEV